MFQEVRLVPDGTMYIHIALILLMIWILNRTFFRPINNILKARERSKGGRSGEAQTILEQVGEKQNRYNEAMLKARSEGYEIIEKERGAAITQRIEKVSSVKVEVAQKIEREKQEVEKQTIAATAAIADDAEKIADQISANLLKTA